MLSIYHWHSGCIREHLGVTIWATTVLFFFSFSFFGPISINQVMTSTAYQQARTVTNVDLIYIIIIQFETKKDFMTKWTEIIGLWLDEYKTPYTTLIRVHEGWRRGANLSDELVNLFVLRIGRYSQTNCKSLEDTFCKQWYRKTSTACAKIFMRDKDSLHQSSKHRFWSSVQHTTIQKIYIHFFLPPKKALPILASQFFVVCREESMLQTVLLEV